MGDIKWAVLGTGVIANEMAEALSKKGKKIYLSIARSKGEVEKAIKNGRTTEKELEQLSRTGV